MDCKHVKRRIDNQPESAVGSGPSLRYWITGDRAALAADGLIKVPKEADSRHTVPDRPVRLIPRIHADAKKTRTIVVEPIAVKRYCVDGGPAGRIIQGPVPAPGGAVSGAQAGRLSLAHVLADDHGYLLCRYLRTG